MPSPAELAWTVRTDRLLLRPWTPDDAPALKDAIDSSLDHLRAWMPWAAQEPTPVEKLARRLARFRMRFETRKSYIYGIFAGDGRRALGGTGLHPRIGAGAFETGYWIRGGETGQGLATEAAAALTRVAFEIHHVRLMEIHCDPANAPSAAIPRKLGYAHVVTVPGWIAEPSATPRDTMIWRLGRAAYPSSAAAQVAVAVHDESSRPLSLGAES